MLVPVLVNASPSAGLALRFRPCGKWHVATSFVTTPHSKLVYTPLQASSKNMVAFLLCLFLPAVVTLEHDVSLRELLEPTTPETFFRSVTPRPLAPSMTIHLLLVTVMGISVSSPTSTSDRNGYKISTLAAVRTSPITAVLCHLIRNLGRGRR